ncbi:PD-(D/E)XK nuclease family transposase [Treponema primitia]|uniref:PD-(D/E)XK nuclease family transposase n=1 Tax=Treponema primitia TaxID=88058 RepID=UPI0039812F56
MSKKIHLTPEDVLSDITRGNVFKAVFTRPTYQISLIGKGRIYDDDDLVHRFIYYDPEHNLSFKGLTVIIDIELEKAEKVATEKSAHGMMDIEKWAVFFLYHRDLTKRDLINEILEYEEGISMATEELLTVTQAERDWVRRESELKFELDMQSRLTYAKEDGYELAKKEAEIIIQEKDGVIQEKDAEIQELRRLLAATGSPPPADR